MVLNQANYQRKSLKNTDKKENEIQMGAVKKSYMRKGFLIYEEMGKYLTIQRPLVIYDFATDPI